MRVPITFWFLSLNYQKSKVPDKMLFSFYQYWKGTFTFVYLASNLHTTDMTIEPFCIINKDWIELTCKTSFYQLLPTKGGENGVWKAQEEEDESFRVIILNCQKTVMEKCVSEVAWSMRTEEGQRLRQILTQREKYAGQGVTKQQLKAPIAFPQTIGGPLRRKTTHWHQLCISYSLLNILNYQYIRFLQYNFLQKTFVFESWKWEGWINEWCHWKMFPISS